VGAAAGRGAPAAPPAGARACRDGAAARALALAALGVLASVRAAPAQCPDGTPPPCGRPAARAAATTPPAANSVAVLYFATRDTADLYLAEGLTEDIATGLGRLAPHVEVKAPSSVRRAQRERAGDLRSIGRALAVRYLVDGGLRRTPAGYRVSVRLVNGANELTAWGQTYDQTAAGLLDLPAAVSRRSAPR
jgi:TolB-like protein